MALLVSNGIGLDLLDTQGVSREAVLSEDRTVYHWTDWYFDVIGVINPDATSYNAAGVAAFEQSPVVTDAAIRHRLMQPQRTLIYMVGNEVLLQTPATGYLTDANNGPTPLSFDILEVQGISTLLVRYRIKCSVNECSGGNRPLILSHRWTVHLDHDVDHYTTRTVDGIAVFRSDELLRQGRNPDQFRRDLFHPVGDNMKRENIKVDVLSDGNSVRYSFTDTEQAFNLGTRSFATRVEVEQTGWMNQPNILMANVDFALGEAEAIAQLAVASVSGWPGFAEATAAGAYAVGLTYRTLRLARSIMADFGQHIKVRIWGDRNSRRTDLRNIALGVAISKVGDINFMYATEAVLSEDGMGKFIEFNLTQRFFSLLQIAGMAVAAGIRPGNPGAVVSAAQQLTPGMRPMLAGFSDDETVKGPQGLVVASQNAIGNPPFPNSSGTRGTWLGDAVAEALQAPCGKPAAPRTGRNTDQSFR